MKKMIVIALVAAAVTGVVSAHLTTTIQDTDLATEPHVIERSNTAMDQILEEAYEVALLKAQEEAQEEAQKRLSEEKEEQQAVIVTEIAETVEEEKPGDNTESSATNSEKKDTGNYVPVIPVTIVNPDDVGDGTGNESPSDNSQPTEEPTPVPTPTPTPNPPSWGVEAETDVELDLFSDSYTKNDKSAVKSSDGRFVVAPGTSRSCALNLLTFNEKGAGVKFSLKFSLRKSKISQDFLDNTGLIWTYFGKPAPATDTAKEGSFEALCQAVDGLCQGMVFSGSSQVTFSENATIGWKWPFDGDDAYLSEHIDEINSLKAKVVLTVTATQVP